jgi:hypothetical protein
LRTAHLVRPRCPTVVFPTASTSVVASAEENDEEPHVRAVARSGGGEADPVRAPRMQRGRRRRGSGRGEGDARGTHGEAGTPSGLLGERGVKCGQCIQKGCWSRLFFMEHEVTGPTIITDAEGWSPEHSLRMPLSDGGRSVLGATRVGWSPWSQRHVQVNL